MDNDCIFCKIIHHMAPAEIVYAVAFATSKPLTQTRYDLASARSLLGYEPQDTWPAGTEIVEELACVSCRTD